MFKKAALIKQIGKKAKNKSKKLLLRITWHFNNKFSPCMNLSSSMKFITIASDPKGHFANKFARPSSSSVATFSDRRLTCYPSSKSTAKTYSTCWNYSFFLLFRKNCTRAAC